MKKYILCRDDKQIAIGRRKDLLLLKDIALAGGLAWTVKKWDDPIILDCFWVAEKHADRGIGK